MFLRTSGGHRISAIAGNTDVITPNLDKLAAQSVVFTHAVSCCPVCSPYRASLITGQYPLTTGVFLNDIDFKPKGLTIAEVYKQAGYKTAYIGKWHLDGSDRSAFIPKEKRLGFDYWRAVGCVHDYNNSRLLWRHTGKTKMARLRRHCPDR